MPPDIRFLFDIPVPMRDGVKLSADIYLPAEEGTYPAILQRTPYDNTRPHWLEVSAYFATRGYVVVCQDVRGRCDSEGEWVPARNEMEDGYDSIEWVARQPWCNGKVGMRGCSYMGYVQWMAARERPPHLVTMVSTAAAGAAGQRRFPFLNGKISPIEMYWLNGVGGRTQQRSVGVFPSPSLVNWEKLFLHRPFKTIDEALGRTNTVWREWMAHPTLDDYWRKTSLDGYYDKIDLPVLHITGWYDDDQWGALDYYHKMMALSPARDKQYLLGGPWSHRGTLFPQAVLGGVDFTQAAVLDMNAIHLRWFDYWLKGKRNGQEDAPRVEVFVMGRNEWLEENAWPLPGTEVRPYYLHSGGRANTLGGDGRLDEAAPMDEPTDAFVYNPDAPTPSVPDLESWLRDENPLDQRYVERRDDVLVYTSKPVEQELVVIGTPYMILYAASDAVDTDFVAVLTDVYPDGRSVLRGEGILRASYRESLEELSPITPGKIYEYRIELNVTATAFLPGHRIRAAIMSCRFPAFDRNPNTGAPIGEDEEFCLASQTVYHSQAYPSHILLPVTPF